jgi:hypothetical protein
MKGMVPAEMEMQTRSQDGARSTGFNLGPVLWHTPAHGIGERCCSQPDVLTFWQTLHHS